MLNIQGVLHKDLSLPAKLDLICRAARSSVDFVDQIAVALYNKKSDKLKKLAESGESRNRAEAALEFDITLVLRQIASDGIPRVVWDSVPPGGSDGGRAPGFGFAMPMYLNRALFGFVFFYCRATNGLPAAASSMLSLFGHMVSSLVIGDTLSERSMHAALKTLRNMTHHKDEETASHLERMSRYSELIALSLAPGYGFGQEFADHILLFAPMHDIGKIAIPDSILLKPARLTPEEFEVVKTHTTKGREIIDNLVNDFEFDELRHVRMLRNIVESHHETLDGSGYPSGLRGDEIPIEARIVAVADIFDALTSRRPYKEAWNNTDAFAKLRQLAGAKLDRDCVDALWRNADQVEEIQARFAEASSP